MGEKNQLFPAETFCQTPNKQTKFASPLRVFVTFASARTETASAAVAWLRLYSDLRGIRLVCRTRVTQSFCARTCGIFVCTNANTVTGVTELYLIWSFRRTLWRQFIRIDTPLFSLTLESRKSTVFLPVAER